MIHDCNFESIFYLMLIFGWLTIDQSFRFGSNVPAMEGTSKHRNMHEMTDWAEWRHIYLLESTWWHINRTETLTLRCLLSQRTQRCTLKSRLLNIHKIYNAVWMACATFAVSFADPIGPTDTFAVTFADSWHFCRVCFSRVRLAFFSFCVCYTRCTDETTMVAEETKEEEDFRFRRWGLFSRGRGHFQENWASSRH